MLIIVTIAIKLELTFSPPVENSDETEQLVD